MKAFLRPLRIGTALLFATSAPAFALNQSYQTSAPPPQQAAVQPAPGAANSRAAALAEVNKLLDAKVDEAVLVAYIHNSGVTFNLSASEIIALKDKGASPEVLTALVEHQPAVAQAPADNNPTVQAPMTPGNPGAYSYAPGDAGYPYYDYSYPYYSSYPYYPYYYPSYSYASYGWPYFFFGFSPFCFNNFCHFPFNHFVAFHNGFNHFHDGFHNHGGLVATRSGSGFSTFHGSTAFHGSTGFHTSPTFHTFAGGSFHGSSSFHSGGGFAGGFHGGGGGGFHGGGGGGHR